MIANLEAAFHKHGAPLVLKHDGGSIFHGRAMQELLSRWKVTDLTSPRYWPGYNGKQERAIRDVKSMERSMRRTGIQGTLRSRLDAVIDDLNAQRPRPMLGGCTAREVYERDSGELPDRDRFIEEVELETKNLRATARSRNERQAAHRRAVELVLLRHGLLRETGDVSQHSQANGRTK